MQRAHPSPVRPFESPAAGARSQVLAHTAPVRFVEQVIQIVGEYLAKLSTVHAAPGWDVYRTVGAAQGSLPATEGGANP